MLVCAVFQESDTASAMTTITTATTSASIVLPPAVGQHQHPLTSESACLNVGGNAIMMDSASSDDSCHRRSLTSTNPVPVILPAEHLHLD